ETWELSCIGAPPHGVRSPVSEVGNFAFGPTTKFGRPFPSANPAFVPTPHASRHQSRVREHGPIASWFWYSAPKITWPRPPSANGVPTANDSCVSPPSPSNVRP